MERKASEIKKIGTGKIYIERMKEEDLKEVLAIETASFPTPWTRNMFPRELKDNLSSHFLVARTDKDGVVGYGGFSIVIDGVHISSLAVHPDFRRRKIGERLLTTMLQLIKLRGIKKVALEVRAGNLCAQNLYRKFGFRVVGRHRQYYQDNQEDALLMSLNL